MTRKLQSSLELTTKTVSKRKWKCTDSLESVPTVETHNDRWVIVYILLFLCLINNYNVCN